MQINQKQTNIFLIIGVIAAIIIIGMLFYLGARKTGKQEKPVVEQKMRSVATQKLIETDATDPSHVNNIKYIQSALERYYNDKRQYPKQLEELVPYYLTILPKYSSSRNYFYAHYPAEKPQKYHIGVLLGGRNEASPAAFRSDSDLDSVKVGYINGFNGMDPVFDLESGK